MECCGCETEAAEVTDIEVTHHLQPDLGEQEPHLLAGAWDARLLRLHVTPTICTVTVKAQSSSGCHLLCCVNIYAFHILTTLPNILTLQG